jgi:hypothetical protein
MIMPGAVTRLLLDILITKPARAIGLPRWTLSAAVGAGVVYVARHDSGLPWVAFSMLFLVAYFAWSDRAE